MIGTTGECTGSIYSRVFSPGTASFVIQWVRNGWRATCFLVVEGAWITSYYRLCRQGLGSGSCICAHGRRLNHQGIIRESTDQQKENDKQQDGKSVYYRGGATRWSCWRAGRNLYRWLVCERCITRRGCFLRAS